jgi:hypothetical protein
VQYDSVTVTTPQSCLLTSSVARYMYSCTPKTLKIFLNVNKKYHLIVGIVIFIIIRREKTSDYYYYASPLLVIFF